MKALIRNVLIAIALLSIGSNLFGADRPKVLLIMQEISNHNDYMIQHEIQPMVSLLKEAGYYVDIASETGKKLGFGNTSIVPDMKLNDVKVEDYAGILIPCMAVLETKSSIPKAAIVIAQSAFERGLPIAAQNSGVTILGQANLLAGKKYAIEERYIDLVPGGEFKGPGIVQDGRIVTSGICPFLAMMGQGKDGTADLIKGFITLMEDVR